MPEKIALYARVSTEEQAERGTIEVQITNIRGFCAIHKLEIIDEYVDDGISGVLTLEKRPEGARMMKDAQSRRFDKVLVYKLDRLARDARIALNTVHELKELSIQFASVTEPFDTTTAYGQFLLGIFAQMAALERATILERTNDGTIRAAKKGQWLGGIVPYGYIVDENKILKVANEKLIPGTEYTEADIIKMIYLMVGSDKKSCVAVADRLNALKIPTAYNREALKVRKGTRKVNTDGIWRPARIRSLIVNETYMGIHKYGKRTKKENSCTIDRLVPAIIPEELWNSSQQALKDNQIKAMRNAKRTYLLRSLIKCGKCSSNYSGTAFKGKNNEDTPYYICNGKNKYRVNKMEKCTSRNIPAIWIEDYVWNECSNFLSHPGDVVALLESEQKPNDEKGEKLKKQKDLLTSSLLKLDEQRHNAIRLQVQGTINEDDLVIQLSTLVNEKKTVQDQICKIELELTALEMTKSDMSSITVLLDSLHEKLRQGLTPEVKRDIINVLVNRIVVLSNDKNSDINLEVEFFFTQVVNRTDRDSCLQ